MRNFERVVPDRNSGAKKWFFTKEKSGIKKDFFKYFWKWKKSYFFEKSQKDF
jgi:hypothetical protein